MAIDTILEPVAAPRAFSEPSEEGDYSRAALLLWLGLAMNWQRIRIADELASTPPFELPRLAPAPRLVRSVDIQEVQNHVRLFSGGEYDPESRIDRIGARLVEALYSRGNLEPSALTPRALIYAFLRHPKPLLRACAAASWLNIAIDGTEALRALLPVSLEPAAHLARRIALIALTRAMRRQGPPGRNMRVRPATADFLKERADSLVVHGTEFSFHGEPPEYWYMPQVGDFHTYLAQGIRPRIYAEEDFFRWSGAWSDGGRKAGAKELSAWLSAHRMQGADVFAHSHGGSVAMAASRESALGLIVLLSCPVYSDVAPTWSNVQRVVSIRLNWDLVIMADSGGQRFGFTTPQFTEHVLPFWFLGHEKTHDPEVWRSRNLDRLV